MFAAANIFRKPKTIFVQLYQFEQSKIYLQQKKLHTSDLKFTTPKQHGNYKPSTFEKYLLVWMKKYPSVADVPKTVSHDMMTKVKDWSRIKINILFCILTGVACVVMVYSGKKAASRGESVRKINKEWHEEQNTKG